MCPSAAPLLTLHDLTVEHLYTLHGNRKQIYAGDETFAMLSTSTVICKQAGQDTHAVKWHRLHVGRLQI